VALNTIKQTNNYSEIIGFIEFLGRLILELLFSKVITRFYKKSSKTYF
jgi:hypothetical protein